MQNSWCMNASFIAVYMMKFHAHVYMCMEILKVSYSWINNIKIDYLMKCLFYFSVYDENHDIYLYDKHHVIYLFMYLFKQYSQNLIKDILLLFQYIWWNSWYRLSIWQASCYLFTHVFIYLFKEEIQNWMKDAFLFFLCVWLNSYCSFCIFDEHHETNSRIQKRIHSFIKNTFTHSCVHDDFQVIYLCTW